MKKILNYFFEVFVFFALIITGIKMLNDGEYVFGALMGAACVWQGLKIVKIINESSR